MGVGLCQCVHTLCVCVHECVRECGSMWMNSPSSLRSLKRMSALSKGELDTGKILPGSCIDNLTYA